MPLQEDLLKLEIIDKRAAKALAEKKVGDLIEAVQEYQKLRKSIRTLLLPQSVSSVNNETATDILKKITSGEGLPTDKIIGYMLSVTGSNQLPDEFNDADLDTLGSDLFYSWFSHIEYITGLSELRPLVIRSSVRENVVQLVEQIKNCYAFQQYGAAYSLCRILIEACIRDICVQCNLFPNFEEKVVLYERFTWKQLREKVSSGSLEEDLKEIYSKLSKAIHARKTVSKDEAHLAFEKTLKVVEDLYMNHGL